MKHTREEILNALHVIKDTCYESYEKENEVCSCYKCPFSDCYGHCTFLEQLHYLGISKMMNLGGRLNELQKHKYKR